MEEAKSIVPADIESPEAEEPTTAAGVALEAPGTEQSPEQPTAPEPAWRLGDRNYRLLSQLTGVSEDYLSRVLRGRSKPSLGIALKIADAAGIEPRVLHEYLQERQAEVQKRAAELTPQVEKANGSSNGAGNSSNGGSAVGTYTEKSDGQPKLSDTDVDTIRLRYANRDQVPVRIRDLAAEYNVSPQTISDAVRGVTYKGPIEVSTSQ